MTVLVWQCRDSTLEVGLVGAGFVILFMAYLKTLSVASNYVMVNCWIILTSELERM